MSMIIYVKNLTQNFLTILVCTLLAACGGGSDESVSAAGGSGGTQNGFLSLSITDAPIDNAKEVWIQFDAIELKPSSSSDSITVTFNPPKTIDLLTLQGEKSVQILTDQTLPTGTYNWIKVHITAVNDGVQDSYIKLDDNSVHELDIPSGSESGLKIIGGLEIIANTSTTMTIDVDLRMSIILTGAGDYKLAPVLKLVEDAKTGTINGSVNMITLTGTGCNKDPSDGNAIYLYEGFNVKPDDIDGVDPEPVASALLTLNNTTGFYDYSFGFVLLGKYTAVYTCEADLDDTMNDDNINFSNTKNVNLISNKTLSTDTFR